MREQVANSVQGREILVSFFSFCVYDSIFFFFVYVVALYK
jgi:hypothetical protein